jgi:uncharacterized membrane protein
MYYIIITYIYSYRYYSGHGILAYYIIITYIYSYRYSWLQKKREMKFDLM